MSRRQRRRLTIAIVLGVAALIAIAAWPGSGDSPAEQNVRARADAFWTALGNRDGAAACDLASPEAQRQLESVNGGVPRSAGCAEGAETFGRGMSPSASGEVDGAEITIDGSRATAEFSVGFCMPLEEVDGEWLVAGIPPPVQPGESECSP